MNTMLKLNLNELAGLFYKAWGYKIEKQYDFSASKHPQEIMAWNQALIAFNFTYKDQDYLKYQIKV
jgi:hypothetical protein